MRAATNLTDTDIAELRRLRTEHGLSITQLSARFRLGAARVLELVGTEGMTDRSMNVRIAKCVQKNPTWSNEAVAEKCGCSPTLVKNRRPQIKLNAKQRDIAVGIDTSERSDRGNRVSRVWLRQHCSRGERDLRQIQAMCTIAGLSFSLTEIKASCIAAGLIVPTSGPVYAALENKIGGE